VQELARRLGQSGIEIVKQLMRAGVMANLSQAVDYATAAQVAAAYGYKAEPEAPAAAPGGPPQDLGALYAAALAKPQDAARLQPRPPVVTILGHVDHGKTTLLDAIRKTRVAESEAGGITQRIGAYQVQARGRPITFLDTPGHEAFTAMRARGARITDVAVLVVAADDGVMPQTVEAISHAKAAGVPIVAALTKVDKPEADQARVKAQLMERGLVPEEFGGDIVTVPVSAKTGQGIDLLLENLLIVADLAELKADPQGPAAGRVLEAHMDHSRGPVATVLVQNGTLHLGDALVAGSPQGGATWGRVKALVDDAGRRVREAGPSQPVAVLGLEALAQAGDAVLAFAEARAAQALAERQRAGAHPQGGYPPAAVVKTAPVAEAAPAGRAPGQVRELPLIVKTDFQGSVEALRASLDRLMADPEIAGKSRLRLLHAAAGAVTESDILLASASGALVIGFNTQPTAGAKALAEQEGVELRTYNVIYTALEDVRKALLGILEPELVEVIDGQAEVRALFTIKKQTVAGCYVTGGTARRSSQARVLRKGKTVAQGPVASLKRFKDDAREIATGLECGVAIEGFRAFQEGDRIEFFHTETKPRG
jgi:translation initiation factor IF-2